MNNCTFFGMRPGKEQRDLCWGDLQLKTDWEGNRFIEFNIERQRKTGTIENPRSRLNFLTPPNPCEITTGNMTQHLLLCAN